MGDSVERVRIGNFSRQGHISLYKKIGNKLLTPKEELERHPVWAIG